MSYNEEFHSRSCEDNTNYKAIACQQIPELFLDKIVAKKHFGKFGKIKRFILRPSRLSCTIEYENEEDAKNALEAGSSFNGIDFIINYAEKEEAHVQNTEEWVDPEVQAELDAMSAAQRMDASFKSPLQNPNLMNRIPKITNISTYSPKKVNKVFVANRQNSPQPEVSKIDAVVRQELEVILKTPAFTDEEKYRVLDARDKLIRLTTVRQTDIRKAVATKGSCPDMCPEKERLMREFQRQVSIFETADEATSESKISHKKAIKEYSRSSADQEVPLSHELRTESVLEMTMLYLVHRIMGLCDDPKTSLGDWFHFVWDRTRSIRKDITQQELCSLSAVQLVEQCARFHIHCAARLVAEDPSVFDKKINAENLTKCLQTLKYMYHDLRIKGIECPCETEFRSYVILLNLGDSNFLWELKQLPESIQKSVEIKRAIGFYNALQNNNFVRFFSMIKTSETSYLSACILLGYFTKLRVRAMDAIIKSHNWRKNDVFLPLTYLTNVLGFDDESSAVNFFNHYGLHCDIVDKRVLLDRLIKPSVEFAMDRALQLVESKRQVSVGECIFGQNLPPASIFEEHEPQNSFDDDGLFKLEFLLLEDQPNDVIFKTKPQIKPIQKKPEKIVSSENDSNLFKMPQSIAEFSPKQQRKQISQKDTNSIKENNQSLFELGNFKEDEKSVSHNDLKPQSNIFGVNKASESTQDSIFKTSVFTTKPEGTQASFFNSVFSPFAEKPLTTKGNIFGIAKSNDKISNNIFSTAAKETANIFQQQKVVPQDFVVKDKLEKISPKKEAPSFSWTSTSEGKIEQNNSIIEENQNTEEKLRQIKEEMQKLEELKKLREQKLQEERQAKEREKLRKLVEQKALQITENVISEFILGQVLKLAQTELLISLTIDESADLQKQDLIDEIVKALVKDIANEEYAHMCIDQLLLSRYFTKWLRHMRKKKEQRKLVENTLLWASAHSRAELAESVKHPSQKMNMEMMERYRLGQSRDLKKMFNLGNESFHENPLNMFALVGHHLLAKRNFSCGLLQQKNYFKFIITLPENQEELLGFESFSNKLLTSLIEKSQSETCPFLLGIEHNVALCIRKLNGINPKNEEGNPMTTEADHNDGIVCYISGVNINTQSRKRLYNLLKLSKNFKRIPLAIIAYNCICSYEELAELLDLDVLQEEGLIYSYIILGCQTKRNDFNFRQLLINAVDFITRESYSLNSSEIQALAMQNVLDFLESSLGEEIWQRWHRSTQNNPILYKICTYPEHVMGIYHKALDHLLHITQEDFDEMPEFPEELKKFVPDYSCFRVPLGLEFFPLNWKDKTEKSAIKNFLQSLYLPKIDEKVPNNIEDLKAWLINYVSKILNEDDFLAAKASHEALTSLVDQLNQLTLENSEFSANKCMINYLQVFKPMIYAHTNRMLNLYQKELADLKVIYLKDDLKNYQTQPWWLNYESLNLVTVEHSETAAVCSQEQMLEDEQGLTLENEFDEIINRAEETSCKAEEKILKCKQTKRELDAINSSKSTQLKRLLDDSLYQFELSKKVGEYDTSFVTDLTQEIDKSISEVINKSTTSRQKRKLICQKTTNQDSEFESVIAKASKLIHNIESLEDKKYKKNFIKTDQINL